MKKNGQLPPDGKTCRRLGERILRALVSNTLFVSAAVPLHIFPPLINRYVPGQFFGEHVDNCIRGDRLTGLRIRTDLSVTLFLAEPEEYDGGELLIDDYYGSHRIKLPAGHLVLYPSTSLHWVTPITRGARICSFFWLQSMIKDPLARRGSPSTWIMRSRNWSVASATTIRRFDKSLTSTTTSSGTGRSYDRSLPTTIRRWERCLSPNSSRYCADRMFCRNDRLLISRKRGVPGGSCDGTRNSVSKAYALVGGL